MEEYDGQLALDVFDDGEFITIKAPIAGVKKDDLEITITDEIVMVKGTRHQEHEISKENYFCQECYWGSFSRSYVLPVATDSDRATATLKEGILTIKIPKIEKTKTRVLKVNTE